MRGATWQPLERRLPASLPQRPRPGEPGEPEGAASSFPRHGRPAGEGRGGEGPEPCPSPPLPQWSLAVGEGVHVPRSSAPASLGELHGEEAGLRVPVTGQGHTASQPAGIGIQAGETPKIGAWILTGYHPPSPH